MKKIIFTIIVSSLFAFSQDKLEDLVDLNMVKEQLNCDPVLQQEYKEYLEEHDFKYVTTYKPYIIKKNYENNLVIHFCKIIDSKNPLDSDYYIVVIEDNKIKDYFPWFIMGELKFSIQNRSKVKLSLNNFRSVETQKIIQSNKIVSPSLYLSTPDGLWFFYKFKEEWCYGGFD